MTMCPECKGALVAGAQKCPHCGFALGGASEDGSLVEIWRAQGEMDAQLVRSMLESSGIDSVLLGESLRLTHAFTVDGLAEVRILVRKEDVASARELLVASEKAVRCPECENVSPVDAVRCRYCDAELR